MSTRNIKLRGYGRRKGFTPRPAPPKPPDPIRLPGSLGEIVPHTVTLTGREALAAFRAERLLTAAEAGLENQRIRNAIINEENMVWTGTREV